MNRARVMDWGSYTRYDGKITIPFKRLVELGLCDCFIAKGGRARTQHKSQPCSGPS